MSTTTLADIAVGTPAGDPVSLRWTSNDALLYALAVGAGQADPAQELDFTTNNTSRMQRILPTFGATLGGSAGVPAMLDLLGDRVQMSSMLHGDQRYEQAADLPPTGSGTATTRISAVWDKGAAAVVQSETEIVDDTTGQLLARATQSMFFRGAGGFGGERGPSSAPENTEGAPDLSVTVGTRADQPLLYRLTGDSNPLHTDPAAAQAAGFPRPILHGMCHYGIAGRVLVNELLGGDPARFRSMFSRFTRPVMPGDDLRVDVWHDGDGRARFTVSDPEGNPVQSGGVFEFAA